MSGTPTEKNRMLTVQSNTTEVPIASGQSLDVLVPDGLVHPGKEVQQRESRNSVFRDNSTAFSEWPARQPDGVPDSLALVRSPPGPFPTANQMANQQLGKSGHRQGVPRHGPSPRERGRTKESRTGLDELATGTGNWGFVSVGIHHYVNVKKDDHFHH